MTPDGNDEMALWYLDLWEKLAARNADEPPQLRHLFYASLILILAGNALAFAFALMNGLWAFEKAPQGVTWLRCCSQLKERSKNEKRLQAQIAVANKRKDTFEKSLDPNPSNDSYFSIARAGVLEEEEALKKLNAQARWYQVQSLHDSLWMIAGIFLVPVLLSFCAGRLMLIHGARSVGGGGPGRWRTAYWVFTGLGAGSIILREIVTSALAGGDKIWFGWMSFCICPGAWFSMWLTFIGLGMVVAYPSCIIWCFSRTDRRPATLDAQATDGCWGVGNYVLFLQTWSLAIFIFVITGSVLYIDISATAGRFAIAYAAPPMLLAVCAAVVGSRLVWNGIGIRLSYQNQLESLGRKWPDIQAQKPPPDPTIGFLGDNWWKLPATIFAALTALWTLTQLLLQQGIFGSR
jgi:hypothetical protein